MKVKTNKGELPVHFGMNTLARFGDETDKSMNEVMGVLGDMGKLKLSELMAFFFAAFIEGALEEDEECKVKDSRGVARMIDEDPNLVTKMMTAYTKQSAPEDEVEETEGKKK